MVIRRLLTIPTGIVFFVSLLITLVVLEVNASFMDVDFYPEQMRKADIYNFLLVDLLASGWMRPGRSRETTSQKD